MPLDMVASNIYTSYFFKQQNSVQYIVELDNSPELQIY